MAIGDDYTIERLEKRIEALEEMLRITGMEKIEPKKWPQVGDEYHWVADDGEGNTFNWSDSMVGRARKERGLIFRTEAEALAYDRKRVITEKLRKMAGGFVPDWGDDEQDKYYIFYNHSMQEFVWACDNYTEVLGTIYFASKTDAIEDMGDELYELWGVEK